MVGTGFDSRGLFAEYRGSFQSNPTLSSTKNVFKIKIPVSKTTISAHKSSLLYPWDFLNYQYCLFSGINNPHMGFDNEPKNKMFDLVAKKFQHLELSKMLRFLRLLKTKE